MSSIRPSTKAAQAMKIKMSELYIGWLTSAEAQEAIHTLVEEAMAAAGRQPSEPTRRGSGEVRHTDPTSDVGEKDHSTSPSPPPSPPITRAQTRPSKEATDGTVHLSTRFLGVDEVDMNHRSVSPGGASPVSPNTAIHKHAVDPSIPVAPAGTQLKFVEDGDRSTSPSSQAFHSSSFHSGRLEHSPPLSTHALGSVPVATTDEVPIFYEPGGIVLGANRGNNQEEMLALDNAYAYGPGRKVDPRRTLKRQQFSRVCSDVFAVPEWLKDSLFRRIAATCGQTEAGGLTHDNVRQYYESFAANASPNRRLFEILRSEGRRNFLVVEDFRAAAKQLVANHPGLSFLTQPEFQDFYCRTVAIRIVYHLERQHTRKVMWSDFDRSDLPETMRHLDKTGDINLVLNYFSYEHFYVLYCRFWEIDTDKDQLVGINDLQNYGNGALTSVVLERVVQGCGRPLTSHVRGKLDFEDFIYFCLSEEDKNSAPAVRYWFNILDLDQDGIISGYELGQLFYEQAERFREYSQEELKLEDMVCQMFDMVGANKFKEGSLGVSLTDLRTCDTPGNFFNMVFNAAKFMGFEHRDPFGEHQMRQLPEKTDWDRFARAEYDRMASEAGGN